jgi:hypothetical protein
MWSPALSTRSGSNFGPATNVRQTTMIMVISGTRPLAEIKAIRPR